MASQHAWSFRTSLKRRAFGLKGSAKAIQCLNEALAEIDRVAPLDPALAGEGAVLLLEKVSPALENIDSSSGALGAAVHDAVRHLVPLIAESPVSTPIRRKWLERLEQAYQDDGLSLIESLGEYWGELCGAADAGCALASEWADQLLPHVRQVMRDRKKGTYAFSQSTVLCHSALFHAGRHDELLALLALDPKPFWRDQVWHARVLAARGDIDEAVRFLEGLRSPWAPEAALAQIAEQMLIDAGRAEEAYSRFGLAATWANTHLARYRAIAQRYPTIEPQRILGDLIESTPGEIGKWFATAKTLKQFDLALSLAQRSPVDPKTLVRAARDQVASRPGFALAVALLALYWMAQGHGRDLSATDVLDACLHARAAAERLGTGEQVAIRIAQAVQGTSVSATSMRHMLGL